MVPVWQITGHQIFPLYSNSGKNVFQDKQKPSEIRPSNITAAKGDNIIIIFDIRFSYKDGITLCSIR